MVVVGALVREDCESLHRLGTIIKVTPLTLSREGIKSSERETKRMKGYLAEQGREYDPMTNLSIRAGKVFSVRWQNEPTKVTVHVAYDDCDGEAIINLGSNSVEVIK